MKTKPFLLATLLLAAGTILLLAQGKNTLTKDMLMESNGHVLTARWAEYEKMHQADRPQKAAEILQDIRDEALQKHLPVSMWNILLLPKV